MVLFFISLIIFNGKYTVKPTSEYKSRNTKKPKIKIDIRITSSNACLSNNVPCEKLKAD